MSLKLSGSLKMTSSSFWRIPEHVCLVDLNMTKKWQEIVKKDVIVLCVPQSHFDLFLF